MSEAFPAAPPDVASQSQERADRTSSDAIRGKAHLAAEQALADKGVTGVLDARRHASEASAIATLGGEATSLDEAAENLGMKGNNYPTYDIASSREVVSVKTHWADDGSLSDSARQAYQRDFTHMLGWGEEPRRLSKMARTSLMPVTVVCRYQTN
ncbi:MAG: hypothetical protein HZY76_00325 [Anaerolineae bacterium]|nr:MAG: hypothetical protein HZY76_00325 [Anaerolineae bacterium]